MYFVVNSDKVNPQLDSNVGNEDKDKLQTPGDSERRAVELQERVLNGFMLPSVVPMSCLPWAGDKATYYCRDA